VQNLDPLELLWLQHLLALPVAYLVPVLWALKKVVMFINMPKVVLLEAQTPRVVCVQVETIARGLETPLA
jgi:hypothetical protein